MADSLERIVGPTLLTNSAATVLSSVASGTTITIRDIQVCNETGSDATFTLSIGTDGAGKRLYKSLTIPANGVMSSQRQIILTTGDILQAYSNTSSALTLTISAVVTT
jgi:hypothetical protein